MRNYVRMLKDGEKVDDKYIVKSVGEISSYKDGYWFEIIVYDSTGEIPVRYWGGDYRDVARIRFQINARDVVPVVGNASMYRGRRIVNVNPKNGGSLDKEDEDNYLGFIESISEIHWLSKTPGALMEELESLLNEVVDEELKKLLFSFFKDDNFLKSFCVAPASSYHHSPYLHGLLHHTLNVAKIALCIASRYPTVNKDVLITGALLHDIGKLYEYDLPGKIEFTTDGTMMGHLFMGAEMVRRKCDEMNISDEKCKGVVHIILSHHGRVDEGKGSAVTPATPEAFIVSIADIADTNTFKYVRATEEGDFNNHTYYSRELKTWIYKK